MGSKLIVGAAALALGVGAWVWLGADDSDAPQRSALRVTAAAAQPAAESAARPEVALPAPVAQATRRSAPEAAALATQAGGVTLLGRVEDSFGAPLEGVQVLQIAVDPSAGERSLASAKSAADGSFQIPVDAQAAREHGDQAWALHAQLDGYVPASVVADADQHVEIVLLARPLVSGHLLDDEGLPVRPPGEVTFFVRDAAGETQDASADVDANGYFELRELVPGRLVRASSRARGFSLTEQEFEHELAPGAHLTQDLRLNAGPLVRGRVVDASSKEPVPFALVWADRWQYDVDSVEPSTVADELGHFVLRGVELQRVAGDNVPFNMVWLTVNARADGYLGSPFNREFAGGAEDGSYIVVIEIQRADGRVTGRLTWPDGSPAAGVLIYAIDAKANMHFVASDAEGLYTLDGLTPGTLALCAREESVETGALSGIAHVQVQVVAGAGASADMQLVTSKATLAGRVLDASGAPASGVLIDLGEHFVAENHLSSSLTIGIGGRQLHTDSEGNFRFEGLLAGRYQARVELSAAGEHAVRPTHFTLDVQADELRDDLEFVVVPAISVSGWVDTLDTDLSSFEVRLLRASDQVQVGHATPDAKGRFRLTGLYPEASELVLQRKGQELARIPVSAAGASGVVLTAPR